jgi:tetratricopeptide (TPR) repeat protein
VSAHAIGARIMDQALLWTLPALIEPFAPLSPLLEAIWQNMIAACESGPEARYEQARVRYHTVLEKLANVNSQDFPQVTLVRAGIAATLAVLDAALGLQSATEWAAKLEGDLLLRASCITIRRLARLEQGDWISADRLRRQSELAALQVRAPEVLVSLLTVELSAYAHARDLVGVKDVSQRMQKLAAMYPGWRPYARDAQARFDLVRGDFAAAKSGFERTLELVPVDERWHTPGIPVWITAQTGLSESLLGLDQPEQARAVAAAALSLCEQAEVQSHSYELIRALALAEAKLGQYDTALARLERLIQHQVAAGVSGLRLGVSYEACATVAIWAHDEDALRVYAQLTAREYRYGASSPLSARYQRLMSEAQRHGISCMPNLASLKASVRAAKSDDLTLTQSMTRTRHSSG